MSNNGGSLSLVVVPQSVEKSIVAVDSDNSVKKISDTFGQCTSIYRGVTRHRWTQVDTKHICGITAAEEKAKLEKGVKVGMTKKKKRLGLTT